MDGVAVIVKVGAEPVCNLASYRTRTNHTIPAANAKSKAMNKMTRTLDTPFEASVSTATVLAAGVPCFCAGFVWTCVLVDVFATIGAVDFGFVPAAAAVAFCFAGGKGVAWGRTTAIGRGKDFVVVTILGVVFLAGTTLDMCESVVRGSRFQFAVETIQSTFLRY